MIQNNKVRIHKTSEFVEPHYELLIDGYIVSGITVRESYKEALGLSNYHIYSEQKDFLQKITPLTLNEFRIARVESIKLVNWTKWEGFNISVSFRQDFKAGKETIFEAEFAGDFVNWKFPYSYNDYFKMFRRIWNEDYDVNYVETIYIGGNDNKFKRVLKAVLNDLPLAEEIEKNLEQVFEAHKKTLLQLKDEQIGSSLLASFDFPKELKVSCEQYLLYFAQFLKDLGINATSNLKEEAGRVLFSVTPTDDIEALDKIREALAVYLNLPSSPIVYDESFAAMRLQQQIENLQHSQRMAEREIHSADRELRLAQTVIEHQDKIIHQKDTVIEQQNKVIEKITSKSIMMDSLENKEEFQKLFEGLEFGESKELKEKLGIKFNPMISLKTLGKTLIGQDDEITSLNLGEQAEEKDI